RCTDERTELLKLEDDVWHTLDTPVRGLDGKARFGGRIDRVDRRGGITHIIDLKTGSVDPRLLNLPLLETDLLTERTQALQLLVYAWTYLGEHPELEAVRAAIVPLQRTSGSEPIVLKVAGRDVIERGLLPSIDGVLAELAGRLLDPAIPFSHRVESRYCSFCVPS
ncbi:MAG: PD-(D/E)XK nuclease family protein, partial [Flavobacteriales bacterium]|nr:PD-(D/E)XK nuclease family protein [Flavobacteriales bacterium]